ncbi:MAG: nucleotidyltransferase [Chloroflexota bacterium]
MKNLERPLHKAISFLEERGFRYAVIGGVALSQWGVVRATFDVDLKVLVPDTDYTALRLALRTAFRDRARPHVPENPLIVAVSIDDVVVDFLLAVPGYEELIIERAVRRELNGWSAWVCSAEDLIIQKVVAGRGKDWLDVEALLLEQGDQLDQAYIQDWLGQFAEALEQPELLTRYQDAVAKSNAG